MRDTLKELLDRLSVPHELTAYETFPWSAYDGEKGITCSAEVRMSTGADEIEAEIQMLYENPEPGKKPLDQIMWFKATPHIQTKWSVKDLRIKGESWVGKTYNWEEKCCNFFRACVTELNLGNIPDIEALLEREMKDKERFGDQRGSGAGKAPKIKPAQLLDMKKGHGF